MFLQQGLFTVSPNPLTAITEKLQCKAIIKKESKGSLLKTLSLFGVNYGTIYPGLEGAARYAEEYFYFKGFKGDIQQVIIESQRRAQLADGD